jgi:dTDP-4-dehydrorhamnose reductase
MADVTSSPVLIIGAGGMLGRAWRELLASQGIAYLAPSRTELDITNLSHLEKWVTRKDQLIINCSAWTDVDGAESNPDGAMLLNAQGPKLLAARCEAVDARLVHYSTDYVFNGQATSPYTVDQPRDPLGVYGKTKAAGEQAIEETGCQYLIIRTSWLYAPWAKNFVRTIAKLGRSKPSLKVVHDQRGRPTSSQYLAAASLELIRQNVQGIAHVTDGGECTWYEFAKEILRLDGSSCVVEPCTTDEFPRPARRPAYSVLDLSLTEKLLGPSPTWQSNLADVMRQLEPLT